MGAEFKGYVPYYIATSNTSLINNVVLLTVAQQYTNIKAALAEYFVFAGYTWYYFTPLELFLIDWMARSTMYWYSTRRLSDLVTRDYIYFPSDGFDDYIARSMWLALPQSRRSSSFSLGIQVSKKRKVLSTPSSRRFNIMGSIHSWPSGSILCLEGSVSGFMYGDAKPLISCKWKVGLVHSAECWIIWNICCNKFT